MTKILIIDDDVKLLDLLTDYLKQFEYAVLTAARPGEGLQALRSERPDLVVLDVMLPEMNGFEVCKRIRAESAVPVIMLTARGDVTDRVVGLELGADDYLAKPFEPRELVARMQSVLRRASGAAPRRGVLKAGALTVDLDARTATLAGEAVTLTTTEFDVLELFVRNPGKALDRDAIMEHLRGSNWEAYQRSVDVLMSRLRQKLHDSPKNPAFFKTLWGKGYLFIADVEAAP